MSRDRGNLTWARRQWGGRTSRAVAREQNRCCLCSKKDKTGLVEGKCTACYLEVQARVAAQPTEAPAPVAEQRYQLFLASGQVQAGPVVLAAEQVMQTACNLLNVDLLSKISTLASDTDYVAFGLANAADYALPNLAAAQALATASGQAWSGARVPYGPVLLITWAVG